VRTGRTSTNECRSLRVDTRNLLWNFWSLQVLFQEAKPRVKPAAAHLDDGDHISQRKDGKIQHMQNNGSSSLSVTFQCIWISQKGCTLGAGLSVSKEESSLEEYTSQINHRFAHLNKG
jgi:hypothetical protein